MIKRIVGFFKTLLGRVILTIIYIFLAIFIFLRLPDIKLLDGVATELLGIFFTLMVIDFYRERESQKQLSLREEEANLQKRQREEDALATYKNSLLRQARSRNNNNVLDAIDIIREAGWLNGSQDNIKLLSGANLSNSDLSNANLKNADLQGTQFNGKTKIDKADFSDAILKNTQFIGTQLSETTFVGADLRGANFTNAHLYSCIFHIDLDSKQKEITFIDSVTNQKIIFEGAKLTGRIEKEENREDKIYIDFKNLNLNGVCFINAELNIVCFDRARLNGCNFAGALLKDVSFNEAFLNDAQFVHLDIGQRIISKQVTKISFRGSHLKNADFRYMSFVDSDFTNAQMQNAKCQNASFSGETTLHGANLANLQVGDTIFDTVYFDGNTVFIDDIKFQDIYEGIRDAEDNLTLDEVQAEFINRVKDIARKYRIKILIAEISLDEYEKREIHRDMTDGGEKIYEVEWKKLPTPLIIEVRYVFELDSSVFDTNPSKVPNILTDDDEF